jgi:hypothetical protein
VTPVQDTHCDVYAQFVVAMLLGHDNIYLWHVDRISQTDRHPEKKFVRHVHAWQGEDAILLKGKQ